MKSVCEYTKIENSILVVQTNSSLKVYISW